MKYKIIIPKEESMSYEEFRKNASNDLIIKFDKDCSRYSEDGNSDNYFYANCKYWESKIEESKQNALNHFLSTSDVIIKDSQKFDYKNTVLPKEEPKSIIEKMKSLQKQWQKDMDKSLQETLEEAMKQNGYSDTPSDELWREGVEFGANWQAERMYSEEDMINASKYGYNFHKTTLFPNQEFEDSCINNTKQWLKQFKNK